MKNKAKNDSMMPYNKKLANQAMKAYGLKIKTILFWEAKGKMPKRYFEEKNIFKINGKTILQLRVKKGLSQIEFVEKFNEKYSMGLSTVSLSNWENGKAIPRRSYQNMLTHFYQ